MFRCEMNRRHGYGSPFSRELKRDCKNPYKRALLIAEYEEVKTAERVQIEQINLLFEHLNRLVNIHGTQLIRVVAGRNIPSGWQLIPQDRLAKGKQPMMTEDGRRITAYVPDPNEPGTTVAILSNI